MFALIRYHFLDYTKSYKYVPPIAMYFMSLLFVYAYKPTPIVPTYLETAIALYLLSAWITVTIFHTEDPVQEQITISHTNNISALYVGKYITALLICTVLSFISVIYPIILQMFNEKMTVSLFLVGFLAHMSFSILGISIASLFTRNMIPKASTAWLSLTFILLITIASIRFKKELLWFLPPVESFLMLGQYKYNILTHTLWLTVGYRIFIFIIYLISFYRSQKTFLITY